MRLADGTEITYVCEVGHPSEESTAVYDSAQYDIDRYDGAEITFSYIQDRILEFSARSGKDAFGKRFRTGTAIITVDNHDGYFRDVAEPGDWIRLYLSYSYTEGPAGGSYPLTDGTNWQGPTGRTWTVAGDGLTLEVEGPVTKTGFVNIFYGRIDSSRDKVKGGVDVTTLRCVDIFADLAAFNGDAQAPAGAGEDAKARLTRILDNVGTGIVVQEEFGTPKATMQATTLASQALSEIQLTMDSEGGDVWPYYASRNNGGGDLGVGYRDWLTEAPRSTELQYRFGMNGVGIPILDAQPQRELQLVVNDATFATTGGLAQNATNTFSIQRYGRRTFRRLDLICEGDAQPDYLATRTVANLSKYRPRVREVTVNVEDYESTAMFSDIQFGDLIVVGVESINGWGEAFQTHVVGITREGYGTQLMITLSLDDAFIENVDGPFSYQPFNDSYHLGGQP